MVTILNFPCNFHATFMRIKINLCYGPFRRWRDNICEFLSKNLSFLSFTYTNTLTFSENQSPTSKMPSTISICQDTVSLWRPSSLGFLEVMLSGSVLLWQSALIISVFLSTQVQTSKLNIFELTTLIFVVEVSCNLLWSNDLNQCLFEPVVSYGSFIMISQLYGLWM